MPIISLMNAVTFGGATNTVSFWVFPDLTNGFNAWRQKDIAGEFGNPPIICFPVNLTVGQTITGLSVVWKGATAHTALPQTKPSAILVKVTNTGVKSFIGIASDNSTDINYYQSYHTISTTFNHTVLTGNSYYLRFYGESGTNAINGGDLTYLEII